jgi:hypothetical protein
VIVLYGLWNKRTKNTASRSVYLFYAKMIVLGAILGPVLLGFKTVLLKGIDAATFSGSVLVGILTAAAFVAIMAVVAYGLKVNEITDVMGQLVDKLKKTFGYQ